MKQLVCWVGSGILFALFTSLGLAQISTDRSYLVNSAAQALVTAGAFAEPSDPPMAVGLKAINAPSGDPFASGSFGSGASLKRPSLLMSMIEERGSGDRRLNPRIVATPSVDHNDGSNLVIARPAPTGKSAKQQPISTRKSVSFYRPIDLAPPTNALESVPSKNAEHPPVALYENASWYTLRSWPRRESVAWPRCYDDATEVCTAPSVDEGHRDETQTRFEPMTIVGLGTYRLAVSLYAPALHDSASAPR